MKFEKYIFGITCIAILLTNCKNYNEFDKNFKTINTTDNISELIIDSCFTIEKILPLKKDNEIYINFISKIFYADDGYILWDNFQNNIFKYDAKGNCTWKITNKGHGPGEFMHINDICLDLNDHTFYVLDGMQQHKVLKYNIINGNFITENKIQFSAIAFHQFDSGEFAFYVGNNHSENVKNNYSNLIVTDSEFQILNSGINFDKNWTGVSIKHGNSFFCNIGIDSLIFSPQLPEIGNTYLITPQKIEPYYRFETENNYLQSKLKKIPVNSASEWLKDKEMEYNISNFWQYDNLFHFFLYSDKGTRQIICNKSNDKCFSRFTNQETKKHAFFSPLPVIGSIDKFLFVNILPAYALINNDYEITNSLININENDNPVLVFYKLKMN